MENRLGRFALVLFAIVALSTPLASPAHAQYADLGHNGSCVHVGDTDMSTTMAVAKQMPVTVILSRWLANHLPGSEAAARAAAARTAYAHAATPRDAARNSGR